MEKGSKKVKSSNESTQVVASRVREYQRTTTKGNPIHTDDSHEVTKIIQGRINSREHSKTCADRTYCGDLILDVNTCNGFKRLQQDCPASCHKCTICKDNEKCELYGDIKKICEYLPEARKVCPKSCGTCSNESKKFMTYLMLPFYLNRISYYILYWA